MKSTMKALAVVVVLSAALGFGCTPTPVTVEVSPPDLTINSADVSPTFTAKVLDREDKPIPDVTVTWSSLDETVCTIDPATGKMKVVGSGRVEINGTAGAATGLAMVTVALYKALNTDTKSLQLWMGQVQKVDATIADETGAPIAGEVVWESSDPKIASVVGSRGEIRGVAPGKTTVVATAKELRAEVEVEVLTPGPFELGVSTALLKLKVGKTAKVEGKPLDENAQPAAGFPVSYEIYDTSVATVDEKGLVTAVGMGETKIGVTAGDKSVEIKVKVQ